MGKPWNPDGALQWCFYFAQDISGLVVRPVQGLTLALRAYDQSRSAARQQVMKIRYLVYNDWAIVIQGEAKEE